MTTLSKIVALFWVIVITACSPEENTTLATEITQEQAEGRIDANKITQDDIIGIPKDLPPVEIHEYIAKKATAKKAKYFVIKKDDNGKVIGAQLYN